MKYIIAGSRHMPFSQFHLIGQAMERAQAAFGPCTEVVCGEAMGADTWGKKWAFQQGLPVKSFPANWEEHGKAAGPIRNGEMARYADALVVFIWDGSRGSANMLRQMEGLGKPCFPVYNGEVEYAF